MSPNGIRNRYETLRELRFDKLKNKYFYLIKNFQTYDLDLKGFLVEDALRSQEMCISTTFLIFDKTDFSNNIRTPAKLTLLGYLTITHDSINLNSALKEKFRAKGINYKSLPALKIGRLCIDERYPHRGIGSLAVAWAVKKAVYSNQYCACRFLTLDATRNPDKQKDSLHFYVKHGFKILEYRNKTRDELAGNNTGTTPMYLDLYHIIKQGMSTINI